MAPAPHSARSSTVKSTREAAGWLTE
jgi:hypothetical protein